MKNLLQTLLILFTLGCTPSVPSAIELLPAEAQRANHKTSWQYGGLEIALYGPDQAQKPIVWEGPLEIKTATATRQYELNLVSKLYVSGKTLFVLSYSGSQSSLDMFNLDSLVHLVKAREISSRNVTITHRQIVVMPACECVENDQCHCQAAQVFDWEANGLSHNKSQSLTKTKELLGVGFSGMKVIEKSKIRMKQ